MHHLVFYLVLCSSSGACGWSHFSCHSLPSGGFSAFSVTGCLAYCHSGGVGWAATLPSFFLASPAPAVLRRFAGFCTLCPGAPVGVVSALWTPVSSPCWLSLTLGWVCFLAAVSMVSAAKFAVSAALRGSSSLSSCLFVLHLLLGWGGLVSGL